MINHSIMRFWFWGGLTGLLFPLALFVIFQILKCFRIAFGEHLLSALLIFTIAILELPVIIVGRALNLPIETGGVAFIPYELSPFGYVLVIIFWIVVGSLIGYIIDRILPVK